MIRNPIYKQTIQVKHIGQIGAGSEVDFFEHPRAALIVRPQWVRDFSEAVTAQVSGDSMAGEGILDGDRIVCKVRFEASEIRNGKLVVARLPTGRSVVKRIYFEGDRVILRSSNPQYDDMVFDRDVIHVEALVKELVRNLE